MQAIKEVYCGSCFFFSNFSIEKLDVMCCMGLYINDLSMHDSSRDLVLAGTQQSAELRLALDQVRYYTQSYE